MPLKIPKLVSAYNNTIHSSIKMKPSKVEKKDEINIRKRLYSKHLTSKRYKYKLNALVLMYSKTQVQEGVHATLDRRGF